MTYLERAVNDGHAKLPGEGKRQKILHIAINDTERYADPEEQIRAEFWAELIYRYGYEHARIGVKVTVPDRAPSDLVDLVVFRDDERKKSYAALECKQDGVTDVEFGQAVEQACGNDIAPVSKETLIAAIKKCHQTLLVSGKFSPLAAL